MSDHIGLNIFLIGLGFFGAFGLAAWGGLHLSDERRLFGVALVVGGLLIGLLALGVGLAPALRTLQY